MSSGMEKLVNAALKVRTPLALAGLALIVLYGIYKQVLSLSVFENIGGDSTFLLLQNVVDKLFWLAVISLILGVACYLITFLLGYKSQWLSSKVKSIDTSPDPDSSPYKQKKKKI